MYTNVRTVINISNVESSVVHEHQHKKTQVHRLTVTTIQVSYKELWFFKVNSVF